MLHSPVLFLLYASLCAFCYGMNCNDRATNSSDGWCPKVLCVGLARITWWCHMNQSDTLCDKMIQNSIYFLKSLPNRQRTKESRLAIAIRWLDRQIGAHNASIVWPLCGDRWNYLSASFEQTNCIQHCIVSDVNVWSVSSIQTPFYFKTLCHNLLPVMHICKAKCCTISTQFA